VELTYQFCQSKRDGHEKAARAVESAVDTVLVVGGDGTVNTIGRALVGTEVALGVIPAGSGNGFARHFGIPLVPHRAVASLAGAAVRRIDVGMVNESPFFVTCSMAWDASIARFFESFPMRGILPYLFAGVHEFFEYEPQVISAETDSGENMAFSDALVFTIANLTQYGGGAQIAPHACPDDGWLELIVARRQDTAELIANAARLFDGSIHRVPSVVSKRFRSLVVKRERPAPIQVDGELVDAGAEMEVRVVPRALQVLVPSGGASQSV
jgi:YegS/Rv2252/BmrU family lipid kinase